MSFVKNKNFVTLDDGVQSVSNCQDCGTIEFFRNKLLDCLLSHYIDICSGFVKDYDLVSSEDGSANAYKLSFSCREIGTTFSDFVVDTSVFEILIS